MIEIQGPEERHSSCRAYKRCRLKARERESSNNNQLLFVEHEQDVQLRGGGEGGAPQRGGLQGPGQGQAEEGQPQYE